MRWIHAGRRWATQQLAQTWITDIVDYTKRHIEIAGLITGKHEPIADKTRKRVIRIWQTVNGSKGLVTASTAAHQDWMDNVVKIAFVKRCDPAWISIAIEKTIEILRTNVNPLSNCASLAVTSPLEPLTDCR